jgi:hypothetical protein
MVNDKFFLLLKIYNNNKMSGKTILFLTLLALFMILVVSSLSCSPIQLQLSLSPSSSSPSYNNCTFPNGSQRDNNMRNWKWIDKCTGNVNFMIKSEWPTFLTWEAWDSCQGCKSASYASGDSSGDSFQVIGDWMRISQRNGGKVSTVSGGSSKEHWFNPPRNESNDKPLEMEWYMYMDASNWGTTEKEIQDSGLTDYNWSAFWAFGHGEMRKGGFGWPNCGEWDIAEWLPSWGGPKGGKGLASGFHNGKSGAFPPSGLKRDGIMYPLIGDIQAEESTDGSGYLWPGSGQGKSFSNWGDNLNTDKTLSQYDSDAITYNTVIHSFLRCTTKQINIWAKIDVDPNNPPNLNINSSMSNGDVDNLLIKKGYRCVFSTYGDFGSNHDMTFNNAFKDHDGGKETLGQNEPTNWHQNMFLVWSVILGPYPGPQPNEDSYNRPLSFYLSDVHLRGGGNHSKALAPPGIYDPELIRLATETTDNSALKVCKGFLDNGSNVSNVCDNRLQRFASDQYSKC